MRPRLRAPRDVRAWHDRLSFAVAALLFFGLLAVLGRRDGPPPRAPDTARVTIDVAATGEAVVTVRTGGAPRADVARALARDLFPDAGEPKAWVRRRTAVARVPRVFEPAARPRIDLNTRWVTESLAEAGVRSVDVVLELPLGHRNVSGWEPPGIRDGCCRWTWRGLPPRELPAGSIEYRPSPGRAVAASVAYLGGFAAGFAGICLWPRRRTRARMLCGAAAVVLVLAGAATGSVDELALSGVLVGWPFRLLRALTLWLTLPALMLGGWVVVAPLPRRRSRRRARVARSPA